MGARGDRNNFEKGNTTLSKKGQLWDSEGGCVCACVCVCEEEGRRGRQGGTSGCNLPLLHLTSLILVPSSTSWLLGETGTVCQTTRSSLTQHCCRHGAAARTFPCEGGYPCMTDPGFGVRALSLCRSESLRHHCVQSPFFSTHPWCSLLLHPHYCQDETSTIPMSMCWFPQHKFGWQFALSLTVSCWPSDGQTTTPGIICGLLGILELEKTSNQWVNH